MTLLDNCLCVTTQASSEEDLSCLGTYGFISHVGREDNCVFNLYYFHLEWTLVTSNHFIDLANYTGISRHLGNF